MPQKAVHVRIVGRVQGVWYRGWTIDTATGLGLSGWVRNRLDGSVEAVFSGSSSEIDQMIEKCHFGPRSANVDQVFVELEEGEIASGFIQRPTE